MPPSIFALYSIFNLDIYDLPSKFTIVMAVLVSNYYLAKLKSIRNREAQEIFITPNYSQFLIRLKDSSQNSPLFEDFSTLPEPIQQHMEGKSGGILSLDLDRILFVGYTDQLSYMADGYNKK